MEKWRRILLLGSMLLLLSGCGMGTEDPYRVDTVVQIPVNPTQAPTQAPETTEASEETESTQAADSSDGKSSSGKKNTSGNKGSSGNKNQNSSGTKATEPPATSTPGTEPEMTEPAATEPAETEPVYNPSSYPIGSLEYAVLDVLNSYRAEAGLGNLSISQKLCGIAALRAQEVQQVWSHTRPDGRHFTSALKDYGYGYSVAAENFAYSMDSMAENIVAKWMATDSKNDILNADFTTAGIGICTTDGMVLVCKILVG